MRLETGGGAAPHAIGSARVVKLLLAHGLVDESRLGSDPLVAGGGKRICPADGALRDFGLIESHTTTGAIPATYARPG